MKQEQRTNNPQNSSDFRPMAELPDGHYAIGRTMDGSEHEIFCGRDRVIWNVRTGNRIAGIAGWRKRCN